MFLPVAISDQTIKLYSSTSLICWMLEIESSSKLLNRVLLFYLYTAYPSNHCMVISFDMWQICWHGPYFTTIQKPTFDTGLKQFSAIFKNDIPLFVSIGKSSWKAFQAKVKPVMISMPPFLLRLFQTSLKRLIQYQHIKRSLSYLKKIIDPLAFFQTSRKYMKGVFMTNCQLTLTIYSRNYNVVSVNFIAPNTVC